MLIISVEYINNGGSTAKYAGLTGVHKLELKDEWATTLNHFDTGNYFYTIFSLMDWKCIFGYKEDVKANVFFFFFFR